MGPRFSSLIDEEVMATTNLDRGIGEISGWNHALYVQEKDQEARGDKADGACDGPYPGMGHVSTIMDSKKVWAANQA